MGVGVVGDEGQMSVNVFSGDCIRVVSFMLCLFLSLRDPPFVMFGGVIVRKNVIVVGLVWRRALYIIGCGV